MFRALIVILGIASLVSGLFITESAQGGVIKVLIASTGTPSGATTALQNAMNTRFGSANVTTCNPSASIPSLTGINVVILNTNMASNEQAIVAGGETTLVNFVKAGGGLVTGEWLNWNIGRNATLQTILPTSGTNTSYTTATSIKYTKTATDDPFMNAGLPGNFTFTALSNGGTGVPLAPLAGATTFYSSSDAAAPYAALGSGVVGWGPNSTTVLGRVVCFSTMFAPAPAELGNANYATLLGNAVDWASGGLSPEPASLTLMLVGGAIALVQARRSRARKTRG